MKRIVVLGCGLVGSVMVRDLATDEDLSIIAVDVSDRSLDSLGALSRVERRSADLSDRAVITALAREADCVVGAVPGRLGYAMLDAVIEAGTPVSDISFAPENQLELDAKARAAGVTVVVDCGVSPGLSNLAIGRAASKLATVESAVIYVGGLPSVRFWPYEYRSVFSPTDVIEEYTRPSRLVENGEVVVRPALSEVELIDFPGVGTLEAFNTDGLRTVMFTIKGKNMKEKTLRYPGHADRMRMLRETGLFSDVPVDVDGTRVVPRRMTEKLLFEMWRRPAGEEELTLLRVEVQGEQAGGKRVAYRYGLLDRTDRLTGASSMARTTGFPCAIMARLLARGEFKAPGVRPPELFGGDEPTYRFLVEELHRRGVVFTEEVIAL